MNTVEIGRENSANLKTINLSELFSGLTIQVPADIETNRIEQAFKLYLEEHPEVISRVTEIARSKPPTWASVAQELKRNAMGKEAGEAMEKARKEFRETFAIGDNF